MTTCAIINKQSSYRHQHLHQLLASKIFDLCHRYHTRLFATYLPGQQNTVADRLSRLTAPSQYPQATASLSALSFQMIQQVFGPWTVDLFATYHNRKLPLFMSW
ncbi:hypothetical protein BDB00DRAFT_917781 [Zychaea mexicana]|uniref:uncharacterized protein n=1 Tax=Zychaea mexicana TaxID=64656 RepID=UPI0022FEC2F6|nr:uncharacterized protein BDB00DRAFT_917781 [Zychaea mexicana]KAI9490274.1 hypothetical protein BDB00DRAFT_917781 [Zychaea mexicana]